MRFIFVVCGFLLVCSILSWATREPVVARPAASQVEGQAGARVVMYSQAACGPCELKRRELQDAGIGFEEYFIDSDRQRMRELQAKLERDGYNSTFIGTPTLEVDGHILRDPSLSEVRRRLATVEDS